MKYDDLSFGQTEALMDKIGGMPGLGKLLSGEWVVGAPVTVRAAAASRLLERVGPTIPVAATPRFVVADAFVVGSDGDVPIRYIGEDFAAHFLGLVEEDVPATTIGVRVLLEGSIDEPIFAALGGRESARVALAQLYAFLKVGDRSRWYFFYAADAAGALWAIDAYWRDHGWDLEAYSVTYPRGWRGGGRVVSHI